MILDFIPASSDYVIRIPRDDVRVSELVTEHGLNLSVTASTAAEAVLFTKDPYAALSYAENATERAAQALGPMLPELQASYSLGSSTKFLVPDGRDLYPFQKAGVEYALRRNRVLIGDEPGLGKTPMGIVVANELRAKRVLVVCPANIRLQWADQVRAWSTMVRPIIYPIESAAQGVHPRANWTIVSYDLASSPKISEILGATQWDLAIIDECHYLKTPTARRTRAVLGDEGVTRNAAFILGLTGTPLPNRPNECFTLAQSLCWDAIDFMGFKDFASRYNLVTKNKTKNNKIFVTEKTGRLLELQNRLRVNFMVRREKRVVLPQLPAITHSIAYVDETSKVRHALEIEKLLHVDPTDLSGADINILAHISTARYEMGVAKAPQVVTYADGLLDGGVDKLVIFGWHIDVLEIIEKGLRGKGYKLVKINGSSSMTARRQAVKDFVEDGDVRVFLGNLQSVGVGVDGLQKVCNRALFAEIDWSPANNEQGIGRLERIGQKNAILAEYLIAEKSLDNLVLSKWIDKLKDINTALDRRLK